MSFHQNLAVKIKSETVLRCSEHDGIKCRNAFAPSSRAGLLLISGILLYEGQRWTQGMFRLLDIKDAEIILKDRVRKKKTIHYGEQHL